MTSSYIYRNSLKSDISDELVNIYVQRPIAGKITSRLFRTRVTPNQLTLLAILCGVSGGILLSLPEANVFLSGLCIYAKDILDSADGQLARARGTPTRRGRFLDSIGDFIVNLFVFGGIGMYLYRTGSPFDEILILSILGLLGLSLRVSYHVFYQTAFLHLGNRYLTNRMTEEIQEKDLQEGWLTLKLQKIFQVIYGWQDRLMRRIDRWCAHVDLDRIEPEKVEQWYSDTIALRLGGMMGFGTEYLLLALCFLAGRVWAYVAVSIGVMNGFWIAVILYRRIFLSRDIFRKGRRFIS